MPVTSQLIKSTIRICSFGIFQRKRMPKMLQSFCLLQVCQLTSHCPTLEQSLNQKLTETKISGGPGMSSLTSTFLGNGPYNVTSPNKLIPNENSWHLNHHLIYIDNPVGTGYSSTDSEDGYSKNEIDVGQNLLFALQQFFVLFPNLQKNDFFASGPSYAGKFVPAIGHAIHHDRKRESVDPLKPKINLKGIAIGGGNINPISQIIHTAEFVHQMGLVDSSGQKLIIEQQNLTLNCLKKKDFLTAKHHYDKMCELTPIALMEPNSELMMYRLRATLAFLNEPRTRRAIHVGNNTFHDLRTVKKYLEVDFMTSVVDWLGELLPHYKLMLYSGQLDSYYPYPSLEELISHIKFDGVEEYKTTERQMFRVDNEIAGFTKQVGNYTEVLFLNSGKFI